MLRDRKTQQQGEYELVMLEELVPQDHFLRKVDAAVDFSFIHDMCKDLYCLDNGRPAIDPEVLFKMLLLGYLYGIKSEIKLAQAVNENIAFKWFLGLKLTEKGPDHATISANRVRRFRDNDIAEKIFNEILRQCINKGLVGGAILYTDSTHIKAKANKHRKALVTVETSPKEYIEELDEQIALDREILNKKPFDKDDNDPDLPGSGGTTTKMVSLTDPDSGQQTRDGKPDGFHYSEHRTVDSKNNVIVNVHVEPANINDITPVPKILEEIKHRLGKLPKYMGFDAGYHSAHQQEVFGKYRFRYEPYFDAYICPEGKHLYWKTTNRTGYREYWSSSKDCANCPRKSECMSEKSKRRLVTRHVWQDALEDVIWFTRTTNGRRIYSWRKQTIERSFAEAKENHGLRFARMLGIKNMREQCFLTAAAQNIKRMVMA